jgi:hypothetical protein
MGEVEEDVNFCQFGKGEPGAKNPRAHFVLSRLSLTHATPPAPPADFGDVEFIANATVNLLLKEVRKPDDARRYPE